MHTACSVQLMMLLPLASVHNACLGVDMQVLMEFPQLTMTMPDGREESIMKRTCLVRFASTIDEYK